MQINGLIHDAYYIYNPIIVFIEDSGGDVLLTIKVQGEDYEFRFYPDRNDNITFDLSKLVLGLIPEIKTKKTIPFDIDGAYKIDLVFAGNTDQQNFTRTFVVGGEKGYKKNVSVIKNNLNLNYNKWPDHPAYDFKLENSQITGSPIADINQRKRVKCDDIYLLFRNHKGGFSGYLFEDFDITRGGKNLGYYITMDNIIDSGTEVKGELTVRTKAKREHYQVMEDLSISREIYISEGNVLTRLVGSNSFSNNPKLPVVDVMMSFEIIQNYDSQW